MSAVISELLNASLYKRTQGRIARQLTFAALALTVVIGCFQLSLFYVESNLYVRILLPCVLAVLGLWAAYRIVNIPRFADFLIAVEAEMSKVTWPSKRELWRGSLVVLITITLLATLLFFYDIFWHFVFDDLIDIV